MLDGQQPVPQEIVANPIGEMKKEPSQESIELKNIVDQILAMEKKLADSGNESAARTLIQARLQIMDVLDDIGGGELVTEEIPRATV